MLVNSKYIIQFFWGTPELASRRRHISQHHRKWLHNLSSTVCKEFEEHIKYRLLWRLHVVTTVTKADMSPHGSFGLTLVKSVWTHRSDLVICKCSVNSQAKRSDLRKRSDLGYIWLQSKWVLRPLIGHPKCLWESWIWNRAWHSICSIVMLFSS